MAAERFGSKTDVIVKLVLVFFIALLSFSIGTFVGKKFSDNQYKLAQLEPQNGHGENSGEESRGIASISPDSTEIKPQQALTDDEIAKLAEEFVTDDEPTSEKHSDKNNPLADVHDSLPQQALKNELNNEFAENEHEEHTDAQKHDNHAEPKKVAETKKAAEKASHQEPALTAAQRIVEGKAPVIANKAAAPSPNRIPTALPQEIADSSIGKFTVQVASFANEKEAQSKAAELKDQGFSAFYVSAPIKGTTWYRVSVGLFTTQKEAEAYKKDLLKRAKVSSALVQKVTNSN